MRRRYEDDRERRPGSEGLRAPDLGHRAHLCGHGGLYLGRLEEDLRRHGRCRHSEPQRELEPRGKHGGGHSGQRGAVPTAFGHRAGRCGRSGRRCGALGQKRCRRAHLRRAPGGRRRRLQRRRPLRSGVARFQRRGSHRGAARLPGLCERRGQLGLHGEMPHRARRRPHRRAVHRVHLRRYRPVAASGLLRPAGRALSHGRRHGALRAEARGHGRARRGACESGGLLPGQQHHRPGHSRHGGRRHREPREHHVRP